MAEVSPNDIQRRLQQVDVLRHRELLELRHDLCLGHCDTQRFEFLGTKRNSQERRVAR